MSWFIYQLTDSAKLRALHVPTCLVCLRAQVPTRLACLRAHVPKCLTCLRPHLLTPCVLCVLTCQRVLHALRAYVLTCYNYK